MLNSTVQVNNHSLSFNSVSGTLVKSSSNSKIIRFHMDSILAKYVFSERKPRLSDEYDSKEITVLQVMLCGGDQFLVEYELVEKEIK